MALDQVPEPWQNLIRYDVRHQIPGSGDRVAANLLVAMDEAKTTFDQLAYDKPLREVTFGDRRRRVPAAGSPIQTLLDLLKQEKLKLEGSGQMGERGRRFSRRSGLF